MDSLSERKQALLQGIIEEYVHSAKPVASAWLVDKLGLDLSPATIRNEMKELEEQGLITHPHTSAGRIPTESGYRFYIEHFLQPKADLDEASQAELKQVSTVVSDRCWLVWTGTASTTPALRTYFASQNFNRSVKRWFFRSWLII